MKAAPGSGLLLTVATLLYLAGNSVSADEEKAMAGMSIIGSKELPKALFIVPWKEAEPPLIPEQPVNSLLNDKPRPLDPDVFRRFLRYYDQMHETPSKTREKFTRNN
jgi:hypothetical protein